MLEKKTEWKFPALALIISGGHTQIYQLNNHLDFSLLGQTLDDAVGECLDKSAILLGYNYPGGPVIENLALTGKNTYQLPLPKNDNSLDFSFSGLKSEIARLIKKEGRNLNIPNLACSLQHTLAEILVKKLKIAWLTSQSQTIIIGGGVIANQFFRDYLTREVKKLSNKIKICIPKLEYATDNAAMIGLLTYYKITCGKNKRRRISKND